MSSSRGAAPADPRFLDRLLRAPAARFAIDSASVAEPLARYAALLLGWNRRINLTGARNLETLAREHIADAFAIAPHLPAAGRCIDVGSGAGLPGLVLAVVRPDLAFELLEPLQKRRAFLAAARRELVLSNVSISAARLEEHLEREAGAYELAVSRAVFPLEQWLTVGARLVRPGGLVVGLAGGTPPEISGAEAYPYDLGAGPRAVVIVRS